MMQPDAQPGVAIDLNNLATADDRCRLPDWVLDLTECTLTPIEQMFTCWSKLQAIPWATNTEISARAVFGAAAFGEPAVGGGFNRLLRRYSEYRHYYDLNFTPVQQTIINDVILPELPADFDELIEHTRNPGNFCEFQGVFSFDSAIVKNLAALTGDVNGRYERKGINDLRFTFLKHLKKQPELKILCYGVLRCGSWPMRSERGFCKRYVCFLSVML